MVTLSPSVLTGSRIPSITSPAPASAAVYAVSGRCSPSYVIASPAFSTVSIE
jgi:hypothetical protein